jgi:hypothetical protein
MVRLYIDLPASFVPLLPSVMAGGVSGAGKCGDGKQRLGAVEGTLD